MTYPTSSSASDVWSLRDVYKAEAGGEWPSAVDPYTLQPLGDSSCVRFYALDGDVTDLIGNDTTATHSGSFTTGKVGQAFDTGIPSTNGQVTLGSSIDLSSGNTLSMWAYFDSADTTRTNLLAADNNNGNGIFATVNGSDYVAAFGGASSSRNAIVSFDTWHHLVFSRITATAGRIWVDGVGYDQTGITTDEDVIIRLASDRNSANNLYGLLDHVRSFNKVLTDAEALTLYTTDKG